MNWLKQRLNQPLMSMKLHCTPVKPSYFLKQLFSARALLNKHNFPILDVTVFNKSIF